MLDAPDIVDELSFAFNLQTSVYLFSWFISNRNVEKFLKQSSKLIARFRTIQMWAFSVFRVGVLRATKPTGAGTLSGVAKGM